MGSMN